MTTSSNHPTPLPPRPSGDHWLELTATLSPDSTARLGRWIDEDLAEWTGELQQFVTPRSLIKAGGR